MSKSEAAWEYAVAAKGAVQIVPPPPVDIWKREQDRARAAITDCLAQLETAGYYTHITNTNGAFSATVLGDSGMPLLIYTDREVRE